MRPLSAIVILLSLPHTAVGELVTYSLTGRADLEINGVLYANTKISIGVEIDNMTLDSHNSPNIGLFTGGIGRVTVNSAGIKNELLLEIDSVLLVDSGVERLGLMNSSATKGIVGKNGSSDVISDPNTLLGFHGPMMTDGLERKKTIELANGTVINLVNAPEAFIAAATPEPSSLILICLSGTALLIVRMKRGDSTSEKTAIARARVLRGREPAYGSISCAVDCLWAIQGSKPIPTRPTDASMNSVVG
ncbi:MAG: PEP-CTERM sorting domain-containing protein [Planctomycetaceae bacterium]